VREFVLLGNEVRASRASEGILGRLGCGAGKGAGGDLGVAGGRGSLRARRCGGGRVGAGLVGADRAAEGAAALRLWKGGLLGRRGATDGPETSDGSCFGRRAAGF
jgi:hypothetical protein